MRGNSANFQDYNAAGVRDVLAYVAISVGAKLAAHVAVDGAAHTADTSPEAFAARNLLRAGMTKRTGSQAFLPTDQPALNAAVVVDS